MLVDGGGIGRSSGERRVKAIAVRVIKITQISKCVRMENASRDLKIAEPEKPPLMLLVTCIAEFDPTRIRPLDANGQPVLNDLLHYPLRPSRSSDSCRLRAGGNVNFLVGQRRLMQ
jgi:hypothetical protein